MSNTSNVPAQPNLPPQSGGWFRGGQGQVGSNASGGKITRILATKTQMLVVCASLSVLAGLSACSQSSVTNALSTPSGQLFCAIATGGGSTILAGIVDAAASGSEAGPVAVLATNATAAAVQADCAAAAAAVGGTAGVPVSPPAAGVTVATVAVQSPKSPTAPTP